MAPKLVLKCPPPPPTLSSPPPSLLRILCSSSTATFGLQLSGKAAMYVKEIDEFAVVDRLEEEQKELEKEIIELEKEQKRLREKIGLLEKAKKQGPNPLRAQAVSIFYKGDREPYLPVHRCPTEVETNMYHYPVVRTSLELLKLVVHAMISTIFFSRDILPLSSFGVRELPICFSDEKFYFEEHFLNNGAEPEEAYPLEVSQGRIPMMERNRDKNTDKILDNLENNFFESLVKRELLGIQFLIGRDADHPMEVYETYTISIDYRGKRGPSDRHWEKPDFHDPKEDYMSSLEVKKAILDMFRRIYIVTNRLTTLPEKRCLFFHTFHTPWAPESKNGDDYDLSWSDTLASPTITGWRKENVTSGFIDTGFYGARLSVTYLDPPESNDKARNIPIQVPCGVQFRGRQVRDANMGWEYGTEWVDDELDRRAAAEDAVLENPATPESTAKRAAVNEADGDVSRKKSKTA